MPLVPERLAARQEVRHAIDVHFWEQPVQSAQALDGLAYSLPAEPLPLSPLPSGLSRTQQLLAAQALSIPVLPAFDGQEGGLVLDRVMAKVGGRQWWTALLTRAKVQAMLAQHRGGTSGGDVLKDLHNYAVCWRARSRLHRGLTLNSNVEAPDLAHAWDAAQSLRPRSQDQAHATFPGPEAQDPPISARVWLQQQLPGHAVRATLARGCEYVDAAANGCTTPQTACLDVCSTGRADGIQYRAGLHQTGAPAEEGSSAFVDGSLQRSSVHFQGAVAVEGEAMLWKASPPAPHEPAWQGGPKQPSQQGSPAAQLKRRGSGEGSEPIIEPSKDGSGEPKQPSGPSGTLQRQQPGVKGKRGGRGRGGKKTDPPKLAEAGSGQGGSAGHAPWQPPHQEAVVTHARRHRPAVDWEVDILPDDSSEVVPGRTTPGPLHQARQLPVDAEAILAGIEAAQQAVHQARGLTAAATKSVRAGVLRKLPGLVAPPGGKPHGRLPYTAWTGQPHLKVNAAVGCLARIPLPDPFNSRAHPHTPGGSPEGSPRSPWAAGFAPEFWRPYVRDIALRVFASGAISGQMGHFKRPVLDFTAGSLRLDLGLTSTQDAGEQRRHSWQPAARPPQQRAFALEGRGVWHAMTASLCQQLVGPVRLRSSLRLAVEHPDPLAKDEKGRITGKAVADTIRSIRPVPLEAAWGLDCVLPKTGGGARVAAWWCPLRKQAMAELRLL